MKGAYLMNSEEIKTNQKTYVLQSWSRQKGLQPIPVEKGDGIYFYDYDGVRYSDMSSQLVNMNLGFGNTAIIARLAKRPWPISRRPGLPKRRGSPTV